jgi:hypothetical protein
MDDTTPRNRARRFHANYHARQSQRSMETHGHTVQHFRPPQEVSADEEQRDSTNTAAPLLKSKPPKKSFKQRLKELTVKQWVIIGIVAGVIVLGGGALAAWAFWPRTEPPATPTVQRSEPKPEPEPIYSNLTGLEVDASVNERPVTAIMIENSTFARPQSGLLEAGVIHEAIAEGGITRFMALYQDTEPDYIGPVRSARKPWIQWLLGYDATYAHAGGSPEAIQLIHQWGVKDLNSSSNFSAYWRIPERRSPHNLYTSIPRLREVQRQHGFGKSQYTSLERKEEKPAETPTAREIHLDISRATYNVRYAYDKASNSYKRFMAGEPHTDQRSGKQLTPKVVVALVMTQGRNGIYTTYETIGSGQVYIFQDGVVNEGRWHKSSNESQFTFTDANGNDLRLNRGQTWFTAIGGADRVTYNP